MATIEEVSRSVLAAIDTTASHVLCSKWVAERYRQITSRTRMRHLRRVGEVVIPAALSAGTISVTSGSRTFTPDATSLATMTSDLTGRYIRFTIAWYEIAEGPVGGPYRLVSPLAEATNATSSYTLVARRVRLDPTARWLGDMVLQRTWQPLMNFSLAEMDHDIPARPFAGPWPMIWAEAYGDRTDGVKVTEFYPYSIQDELVSYVYWAIPPTLEMDAEVPPSIDTGVLIDGALIDAMRFNASKAANAGNIEAASYWRNEYRAQSVVWEKRILEALRADRGVDDISFILSINGGTNTGYPRDIITARDQAWARGPYQ